MAGVKGKSGGLRPGAGRKKKPPQILEGVAKKTDDPKVFLAAVMNDTTADTRLRVDAAKALLSAENKKPDQGKKGEREEAAKKAISGKFAPSQPPKVISIRGGR